MRKKGHFCPSGTVFKEAYIQNVDTSGKVTSIFRETSTYCTIDAKKIISRGYVFCVRMLTRCNFKLFYEKRDNFVVFQGQKVKWAKCSTKSEYISWKNVIYGKNQWIELISEFHFFYEKMVLLYKAWSIFTVLDHVCRRINPNQWQHHKNDFYCGKNSHVECNFS